MSEFDEVKLVLWDLDGTIVDSFGVFRDVVKEAAELDGRAAPSEAIIRHNFHGTLDETIGAVFELVDDDAKKAQLLNDFLRIQERYYAVPDEHIFEDAYQLASRLALRGIAQAVVTNRAHEGRGSASPRYLINNSRMQPLISEFVCGDDAPVRKPDPAVTQSLSVAQGLRPSEIVVIGDQFVDAKLAQNLGCQGILAQRYDDPIPHLDELGDTANFLTLVRSLDEIAG